MNFTLFCHLLLSFSVVLLFKNIPSLFHYFIISPLIHAWTYQSLSIHLHNILLKVYAHLILVWQLPTPQMQPHSFSLPISLLSHAALFLPPCLTIMAYLGAWNSNLIYRPCLISISPFLEAKASYSLLLLQHKSAPLFGKSHPRLQGDHGAYADTAYWVKLNLAACENSQTQTSLTWLRIPSAYPSSKIGLGVPILTPALIGVRTIALYSYPTMRGVTVATVGL